MDRDKRQKNEIGPYGSNDPLTFFGGASQFAYVYRKAEKIVTGLYMVTGLLSDAEPLKWKVRKLAGDMLSFTNQIKDTFTAQRDGVVHGIKSQAMEIGSLLDVARYAGLMSEMNARLLRDELRGLVELLSDNRNLADYSKSLVLEESFFESSSSVERPRDYRSAPQASRQPIKDRPRQAGAPGASNKGQTVRLPREPHAGRPAEKKEDRRTAILDIIGKKGTVTIKDISDVIRDFSEKTIQRELLSLVAEGALKKEGERRWSRYSLASR